MTKFLPVILGTDANAYGLARSFHEEFGIKSLAIGKSPLIETRNSKIIDTKIYENLTNPSVFLKTMMEIGEEYKKSYDKLILLSCAEWYTDLIVNCKDELKKYFILPFMDRETKDKLEDKESFYNICEEYGLDYPKTYVVTKKRKDKIVLPFSYPVALKPSSSKDYSEVSFEGKEKSYKIYDEDRLKEIIEKIYSSGYNSNIIIQEYIEGEDDTMWVMNCYSNKNGMVKMMCLARCLLEEHTPYGVGNYKALMSCSNDELYSKIKKFLEDIKYVGFSNFDLKYDAKDGKYKLFEINIRQGRSSFVCTACGCNLARYLVNDYIFDKDEEVKYNYNKHMWLATPKGLLKKYVCNKELLKEALELIRENKYTYTLKYSKDGSPYRVFWANRIYMKDYKLFKLYPPKDDVR